MATALRSACILLAFGCAAPSLPLPSAELGPASFSGERAFAHLERLVALGPRVAATPGAEQARAYVRGELEGLGLEVQEDAFQFSREPGGPPLSFANLWTEIPGQEPGLFIVATPLDTHPGGEVSILGANEGGSGAALLLELGRALHERPLPYTVRLLFLDAELLDDEAAFLGSVHTHRALSESGELGAVRLLLYLHQVADHELEIRRDRHSDRTLRDGFFAVAKRAGHAAAFPSTAPFDEVRLGHLVFVQRHFRRVVALADIRYGGTEVPGTYWRTPQDDLAHCSPESLAVVGAVVLAGLEDAARRQLVVDEVRGAPEAEDGHP